MYWCYQLHCITSLSAVNCAAKAVLQQHSKPGFKAPGYQ